MGLPIFESLFAVDNINEGDELEVDMDSGEIKITKSSVSHNYTVFKAQPIPPFMQELVHTGGLMEWVKKKVHGS